MKEEGEGVGKMEERLHGRGREREKGGGGEGFL